MLVVTSAGPEEGKSTVARYLAAAAASTGLNTVLLEADLHRPSQASAFDADPLAPGLTDILEGHASLADTKEVLSLGLGSGQANGEARASITFIPAGRGHPNPIRLITSERMWATLRQLEEDHDLVIVDAPPAGLIADATELMAIAAGTIVVARVGAVTRREAAALRTALDHMNVPFAGLVINFSQRAKREQYGYGYGYTLAERPVIAQR